MSLHPMKNHTILCVLFLPLSQKKKNEEEPPKFMIILYIYNTMLRLLNLFLCHR